MTETAQFTVTTLQPALSKSCPVSWVQHTWRANVSYPGKSELSKVCDNITFGKVQCSETMRHSSSHTCVDIQKSVSHTEEPGTLSCTSSFLQLSLNP